MRVRFWLLATAGVLFQLWIGAMLFYYPSLSVGEWFGGDRDIDALDDSHADVPSPSVPPDSLRIYVPRVGADYPENLLPNTMALSTNPIDDQYLIGQRLYLRALQSPYITEHIDEADFVMIPTDYHTTGGGGWPAYLAWARSQPYWGRKTLFLTWAHVLHLPPAEFHPLSMMATAEFHPPMFPRLGVDFVIPYTLTSRPDFANRTMVTSSLRDGLLFYRGGINRAKAPYIEHFKNHPQSTVQVWSPDRILAVPDKEDYLRGFLTHRFCLAGSGDVQTTRRTYEAVLGGCIPIIITLDTHRFPGLAVHPMMLPFADLIDWESFAVILPVNTAPEVLQRLVETMSDAEVRRRQQNIERYWSAFWLDPPFEGHDVPVVENDMFEYIVRTLHSRVSIVRATEGRAL